VLHVCDFIISYGVRLSGARSEFKKNKKAWEFYEALPPSYRRKVNWLVISVKKEATRAKRFGALVSACADGRREY